MRIALLFALLASPAFAQGSIYPDKATKAVAKKLEPEVVSEEARLFLKSKMKNHNKDMKELSIAVATLRMAEVERLAQGIANQPRLDPATASAVKLPPRFFELQDLLKKTAQELSDAGKANDALAGLDKYQELMAHCVTCHASFRK